MYRYASFVVYVAEDGESRPLYGGLYTLGEHGDGYFFPTWMAA
jgi:hypothetical protein